MKGIDYDLERINEIAKRTPYLSKIAPSSSYSMHDVHEAGGVPAIINELMKRWYKPPRKNYSH